MSATANPAGLSGVAALPGLRLPPVPYLPGKTQRPDDSLFAPLKDSLSAATSPADLAASDAFQAARAVFSSGYYWEAHELFEAVWMALPPASPEKLLVRGLIQLANLGLKTRMGLPRAAARISRLAEADLTEAARRTPLPLMGLEQPILDAMQQQARSETPDEIMH